MLVRQIRALMWRQCTRHFVTTSQLLRGCEKHSSGGDVRDKAALVTGGASGIGLQCCKALLRCGARGVTIADRDNDCGEAALKELAEEFGNDKAVFVHCDVTKSELVDWAFKTTLNAFNRLDIVVNNAGVLNDKVWENEIHTNVCGTMVGSMLGLQYMAAHCAGEGGFVVNIGSTMGLSPCGGCPIYSMTQAAILGLSRALGAGGHIDRTKVKVIAVACGLTDTPLMKYATKNAINNRFSADFKEEIECHKWQKPDVVAHAVLQAIKDGESGALWVVESGCRPYKICIPCYQDMKEPTAKSTIAECAMPGKLSKPRSRDEDECDDRKVKTIVREKVAAAAPKPAKGSPPAKAAGKPAPQQKAAPKPKPVTKTSSKSRTKSHGSCGKCPEPKWHDGPPPKKEKKKPKKQVIDDADDSCHIDLNIKRKKKEKKSDKCAPKIKYSGTCNKPGDKTKKGAATKGKPPPPPPAKKGAPPPPKKVTAKAPPKPSPKTPPKAGAKPKSKDEDDYSLCSEWSFDCKCDDPKEQKKALKKLRKAQK